MIQMKCGQCDKLLKVAGSMVGKRVKCPGCSSVLVVPGRPKSEREALAGFAKAYLKARKAAVSWPQVSATITSAEVVEERHRSSDRNNSENVIVVYLPKCTYTYVFEGQSYIGTRFSIADGGEGRESLERRVASLREHMKAGTPVPAYVDPENPDRAVLFTTFNGAKPVAVFSAIFVAAGVALCWNGVRLKRKARRLSR